MFSSTERPKLSPLTGLAIGTTLDNLIVIDSIDDAGLLEIAINSSNLGI